MASVKAAPPATRTVSINYSDTAHVPVETCNWSDHGVCLRTKWYFPPGAELELEVVIARNKHLCAGVVVACDKLDEEDAVAFATTLYFVNPPCASFKSATRSLLTTAGTIL